MKKIKLVGLPILALTAIAGLASCAGESAPKQKPGVIFHASAMIRKLDSDQGEIVDEPIDFKDKECAKVTITDEEKLQYGKQDVEIVIEPKDDFFSFRRYDIESWAAVDPDNEPYLPSRPYVGLGSPVSLYNYPLQENVAWTFTDLSEEIKDAQGKATGFYKEKYKITVKKEYFQKNIVIDYGNVETLDNSVYVYNSDIYSQMFEGTSVGGDFGKYYKNDTSVSSYAAASPGATVTYTFGNPSNSTIFTFDGWDDVPTQSANSNADKIPYEHFRIYGIKYNEENEEIKENIAVYEPGVAIEEQAFIPTVMTKEKMEYLSFFIRWDLLAEGKDKGFANKYENIQVEINEPTPKYTPNEITVSDDGIKVYPGGLFQHINSTYTKPIDDNSNDYFTYDVSTGNELVFKNVYDSSYHYSFYSVLFELPNDDAKKNAFSISINGKETFNVDLAYGKNDLTEWREEAFSEEDGESELYYWLNAAEGWHLVQLNPEGRTYGFPEGSEFEGKSNLYFLYSNSTSPMDGRSLDISIELVKTETTTFKLSDGSSEYGAFIVGDEEKQEVTLPCGDKTTISIPFKSKVEGTFDIKVTTSDGRDDLTAKLTKDKLGIVLQVYSKTATAFGDGVTCTIDITLPATKVKIRDDAKELGQLDKSGVLVDEYEPEITEGMEEITFSFKLKDDYTADDAGNIVSDNGVKVYYNGRQIIASITPDKRSPTITISIDDISSLKAKGDLFEISIKYVNCAYSDNLETLVGATSEIDEGPLYEVICTSNTDIILHIIATSTTSLTNYGLSSLTIKSETYEQIVFGNPTAEGGFVSGKVGDNEYEITISVPITLGTLKTIPNGLDLAINIEFGLLPKS